MAREILDGSRGYPVVCLTARPGAGEPALSPVAVREIVGHEIPVYFVCGKRPEALLAGLLPENLDVHCGAARVWRPGVSQNSDPRDHPLILDPTGEYQAKALERLAREFCLARGPVDLSLEQRVVLAERQREGERHRNDHLEKELRAFERARVKMQRADTPPGLQEAASGEPEACEDPEGETQPKRADPGEIEEELHTLIPHQWVHAFRRADRAAHPLGRYRFTEEFLGQIAARSVNVPLERIAWVCAMIACGRAPTLNSLDQHALLTGSTGPQLVRGDGAKGWRCSLKHGAHGGPRLHYWVLPDGTEFAAVGNHDGLGRL